jgi:hypothetical protein
MTLLLDDWELSGTLDRDEEETLRSITGRWALSCFLEMVGGGEGGLGLDSSDESGLSSRRPWPAGSSRMVGLDVMGVGMGF